MQIGRHSRHILSSRRKIEFQSPNNPTRYELTQEGDIISPAHRRIVRHFVRHVLSTANLCGIYADFLQEQLCSRQEVPQCLVVDDFLASSEL